jgi:NADH-ubiquinone oxidoreductase chain 5
MIRIGSIALMGVPFRTGFYSKDVILEVAYGSYTWYGHRTHWLGTRAAFCTGFYSRRLRYYTFLGEAGGHRKVYEGAEDAPRRIGIPLRILAGGSVRVGWLTKDRRIGLGTPYWGQALYTHVDGNLRREGEFIPSERKLRPVIFSRGGGARARRRYGSYENAKRVYQRKTKRLKGRYVYLSKKWFFDKVYTEWVVVPARHHGYHTSYKGVDRGVIERRGPAGVTQALYQRGKRLGKRQSGEVYHYTMVMVVGRVRVLRRTRGKERRPRRSGRGESSIEKRVRRCMRYLGYQGEEKGKK